MKIYASHAPHAQAISEALCALPITAPGRCVVLGGDGTMLHAVHLHGPSLSYFGVNCGHLGFLMNTLGAQGAPGPVAAEIAAILQEEALQEVAFPRLEVRAEGVGGSRADRGINDVFVQREGGQACHLRVTVDGVVVVERIVCDGMIVATPLGSTAYSFSAGGPAVHPRVRAIHLTAICPHVPRLPPLALPETARVEIEVLDAERRPAMVVVDGESLGSVQRVQVRGSVDEVRLCFLPGHDFTQHLVEKILQK